MRLIVFAAIRHQALISVQRIVDKRNAAYPVTISYIAVPNTLHVILLARKIPHEITEVHPVCLVRDEEFDIINKIRISLIRSILLLADTEKLIIVLTMALVVPCITNTWNKH